MTRAYFRLGDRLQHLDMRAGRVAPQTTQGQAARLRGPEPAAGREPEEGQVPSSLAALRQLRVLSALAKLA